jgi:hypothetical protein
MPAAAASLPGAGWRQRWRAALDQYPTGAAAARPAEHLAQPGARPAVDALGLRATCARSAESQGALFFDELAHEAHLLPSELETALQELVGSGLAGADSFTGLRSLITPAAKRSSRNSRRGHPPLSSSMAHAGRWALLRRSDAPPDHDQRLEHIARTLLRRYGVICWRLLERESDVLPPWRECCAAITGWRRGRDPWRALHCRAGR